MMTQWGWIHLYKNLYLHMYMFFENKNMEEIHVELISGTNLNLKSHKICRFRNNIKAQ